jgi:signal transduction histidine kinase
VKSPAAGRVPLPTEMTLLQGFALARWCAWGWVVFTTVLQRDSLRRPILASVLIVGALMFCALCTSLVVVAPRWLLSKRLAVGEVALSMVMLVADGWVFETGHSFGRNQSLASSGPLVAVMAAAAVLGPRIGAGLAALTGGSRLLGAYVNNVDDWSGSRMLSVASTVIQYAIAALMIGIITRRLRIVETEVVTRRARDEIAGQLHDGVLQTLALVERRTKQSDPVLAAEARRSDRELRSWLFHGTATPDDGASFGQALHRVVDRLAATHDLSVTVNCLVDDDVLADCDIHQALIAASGEALVNVAKHSRTDKAVVFADLDDRDVLFVSVRDSGVGFDTTKVGSDRAGLSGSIIGRVQRAGGRAEIVSTPGTGTEVRLWSR